MWVYSAKSRFSLPVTKQISGEGLRELSEDIPESVVVFVSYSAAFC